jgi:hypothetical protein
VSFALGCPRQNLRIYASPDTKTSRIALLQCKISGTYARKQKDINGFAFIFKASIGPVGREEHEYIHEWMLGQRFVTFEESEPSMEFDNEDEDAEVEPVNTRPAPMWDDADEAPSAPAAAEATPEKETARTPSRRGRVKTTKHEPEKERSRQVKVGRQKTAKGATH